MNKMIKKFVLGILAASPFFMGIPAFSTMTRYVETHYDVANHRPTATHAVTLENYHTEIKDTSLATLNERVMVVGGSSAHGFMDPHFNSYIRRAFQSYAQASNTSFTIFDRAFYGGEAVKVPSATFQNWLNTDHPQVVVISWGMLNDIHNGTSLDAFDQAIHTEIQQSLAAGATVLMVTPPPVIASISSTSHTQFEQYINAEQETAASFNSPNVFWLDLNQDMLTYLRIHNEKVASYCANSWHPNQAGHQLGGQLLSEELTNTFRDKPIPALSLNWTSAGIQTANE